MNRGPDIYTRWSLEVRRQPWFHAGQRVGVAVSGGPDSVLLLHFMHRLAREGGIAIAAVHFNHRLRGAESEADEALVRDLAKALQIPYLRSEADVGRMARERRANLEAVARDLRYRFFFSLVDEGRLDRVATAHTANDQAETVLMRLLRGTGTRGLGGIYPVLEGKVVRPFLGLARDEVMQEIAARGLPHRVDSSNLDPRLQRNKIRGELLPLIVRGYNPGIIPLLNQFAERARDDEVFLERLARDRSHPWRVHEDGEERIPIRALSEFPPALGRRVLRQMLHVVRGSSHSVTYAQIESLRHFAAESGSGKIQTLPGGVVAHKEFSWLVLNAVSGSPRGRDFSYPVIIPGEYPVPELGCVFRLKILNRAEPGEAYNWNSVAALDSQKLRGRLELRNWRAGDRFCPLGRQRVRKLKELFSERKIPEVQRRNWPVLVCAGQVAWVRGFPPGRGVAATSQTARAVIVEEEPTKSTPRSRNAAI
jgi:tRNA(Ile)-lysidine synthase